MEIRRTTMAALRLIGGVLLALCLGSKVAQGANGTIKGPPVKPFRPVFDLYIEYLKVRGAGVTYESSGTFYFDERSPYEAFRPVALECVVKLKEEPLQQAKPGPKFSTKIEVYRYDANGNGAKVAENYVLTFSVFDARSGVYHRWTWTPTQTGRYMFRCTADARYEVDETNEHNNAVGNSTYFVLHKGVPADAFKVRIASPTPNYVYPSPAETAFLKIEPVLADWWAEQVYLDVLKWDAAKQNWVQMNPPAIWNNTWGVDMPLSERGWGYYMVRAVASNAPVINVNDKPYSTSAEPVFFWVGKPTVGIAGVAKGHLPLPHVPRLKKDVPIKPPPR